MNHKRNLFLVAFIGVLLTATGFQTSPEYKILFEKARFTMETKGDLNGAINLFNDIIKKYPKEREYAAKSQLYIGLCYEKLGGKEAQKAYERVVREYADQSDIVTQAKTRLAALGGPAGSLKRELSVRQVWAGRDADLTGSPSIDGRFLSTTDWNTGDVAIRDLITGEMRHVTKTADVKQSTIFALNAIYSPDNQRITYAWYDPKKFQGFDLWLTGADGTGAHILYHNETASVYPNAWTPDGKNIIATVFPSKENVKQIVLVSASDGSTRLLKSSIPDRISTKISVSPDGLTLVYDMPQADGKRDIFLFSLPNGPETRLVEHPADDGVPIWQPDGKAVLFMSDRTGSPALWAQKVIYGKTVGLPELVKQDIGRSFIPMGFSRNGALYYGISTDISDVYVATIDLKAGRVIEPSTPISQQMVGTRYLASWSPDGKYLAYLRLRTPGTSGHTIIIRTFDGGEERSLNVDASTVRRLVWSPDGTALIFPGLDRERQPGVFRVNLRNGVVMSLVQAGPNVVIPQADITHDGKSLVYLAMNIVSGVQTVVVRDLQSGQEKVITKPSPIPTGMALSPDGLKVAVTTADEASGRQTVLIVPVAGGAEREIYGVDKPRTIVRFPAWTPDGRQILCPTTLQNKPEYFLVPVDGGEPQKMASPMKGITDFSFHPDGRRIAFSAGQSQNEVWVIENFLPKEKIEENNQLTLRKLDNSVLNTPYARLSPDGCYISYPDWNTGDLAIQDMVTGKDRRLTNKGSWASSSDYAEYSLFSPDSKQIAYTWQIWSKNHTELRIINTDGSQPRVIYQGDDSWPVSWSSNGKYILVKLINKDQTWRPAIISVADSSVRDLAFQISGAMCFSPDGKYIAYDTPQVKDSQQRDVYLYEIATKHTSPLVKHPADDGLLGWAPDGKHLLFTSDRNGTRDAWLITVTNGQSQGEPALVRKNIGDIESIGFTQSGDFYFHESIEGHNIYTARLDLNSGKLLSPPVETAGSYLGSNWRPDFSRDGKFLAYISNRGSGEDQGNTIVIRSLETGKEQLLKPALEIGFGLRWAPDGRSIFVNGTDNTKREGLFQIDVQTGEANLIVERHFVGVPGLEVSPDGRKIFYTAVLRSGIPSGESAYDVRHFVRDLQSGQEQELTRPGNTPLVPLALSPDGDQLAFIGAGDKAGSTGICVMPSSGGPSKQIVDLGTTGWASRVIAWSPDGRYLIYAVILPKTHDTNMGLTSWELWRVSSQGGDPQRLDLKVDGLLRHIRIHPDGQQIVYYTWHGDTETWVMQNFLPK